MMYEIKRRNAQAYTFTEWRELYLPRYIGMVWEELAFDGHYHHALTNWAISPPPDMTLDVVRIWNSNKQPLITSWWPTPILIWP